MLHLYGNQYKDCSLPDSNPADLAANKKRIILPDMKKLYKFINWYSTPAGRKSFKQVEVIASNIIEAKKKIVDMGCGDMRFSSIKLVMDSEDFKEC